MITFKRFLSEERALSYSFEEGIKLIKQDCQTFISLAADKPLYRGFGHDPLSVFWMRHPENRSPRDSSQDFNFFINSVFNLAFGIEDARKRSIFATGDFSQARKYGELMFCFPAGEIGWLWSPKIQDSFDQLDIINESIAKRLSKSTFAETLILPSDIEEIFNKLYAVYHRPSAWISDLKNHAGGKTAEIISKVIPELKEHGGSLNNIFVSALIDAARDLYLDTKWLNKAIFAEVEIMIYKSRGYYMVPVSMVFDAAKQEGVELSSISRMDAYGYLLKKIKES